MIVIDLGNKYSTITDGKNKICLPTTLFFDENKVTIGYKQNEKDSFKTGTDSQKNSQKVPQI